MLNEIVRPSSILLTMLATLITIALGQFDFGGQAMPKKFPKPKPYAIGHELLSWDVVRQELGLPPTTLFLHKLRQLPVHPEPALRKEPWLCGGVLDMGNPTILNVAGKRRLREVFVQFAGSSAVLDLRIAAKLNISPHQNRMLSGIKELPQPSLFRAPWITKLATSPKEDFVDARLRSQIEFYNTQREFKLASLTHNAAIRTKCRSILTSTQQTALEKMKGKALGASLHQTAPSCRGAYGPVSGENFRRSLQADGTFSLLRQDVASKLGLKEEQLDSMHLEVQKLYNTACKDADEYWWLLKRDGSKPHIAKYRREVFARYERKARRVLYESLNQAQKSRWNLLLGKPVTGIPLRNHFG